MTPPRVVLHPEGRSSWQAVVREAGQTVSVSLGHCDLIGALSRAETLWPGADPEVSQQPLHTGVCKLP